VWEKAEVHSGFWWEDLMEKEQLEDLSLDGRIILRLAFKKWDGGVDWIDLSQDKDRWRALVYAVMNLRFP
jgi:hypothetical protein